MRIRSLLFSLSLLTSFLACNSPCSTCFGSSTFCLTCSNNQLASNGKCVSTCPSGTFSSSGICLPCHPDCASCSAGGSFSQCTSCPSSRPVLSNGRCLPTCAKNQFFDGTSGTCQNCDNTCSSCSAGGPSNCLACASSSQVLRGGACAAADCAADVPGLGVCLSELVVTGNNNSTLPAVTGLDSPTSVSRSGRHLRWWEILLIAFACAFLVIAMLWCCGWRQRKQQTRRKQAELYATGELRRKEKRGWGWKMTQLVQGIFGRGRDTPKASRAMIKPGDIVHLGPSEEAESLKFGRLRDVEERGSIPILKSSSMQEKGDDRTRLLDLYHYPLVPDTRTNMFTHQTRIASAERTSHDDVRSSLSESSSRISALSIYSQVTGVPRKTPESKVIVRREEVDFPKYTRSRVLKNSLRS